MLLPMKEDPPLSTKCKDKFLVQSTAITPDKDHLPPPEVWTAGPGEAPPEIHQQKIKVAWLASEGHLPTTEEGDENDYPNQSIMSMDESHYATVRGVPPTDSQHNGVNGSTPPMPEPRLDPRVPSPPIRAFSPAFHDSADDHHDVPPTITVHTPPRTPPPVDFHAPPAAVPMPAPSSHPDTNAELAEARAEIQRLRALLDSMPTPAAASATSEGGLRQRKGLSHSVSDKDDSRDVAFEQNVDGFSPQQVLFIAGAVFVLTYLFF
jgi:vesicle-associated membrane protein-associated protein A